MKLFIWDFHGVLEKDNEFAVKEVVDKVLSEFKINRKATVQECLDLYGKKWAEYYRYFAPDSNEETIHQMVKRAVEISLGEKPALKHIKPMDHAHDVLKQISKKGHTNIIISNSSPKALDFFLASVNMSNLFDKKFGADLHRKNAHEKNSKEILLKQFLSKNKFESIILIDDAQEGIEMGKRLNAITYHFSRNNNIHSDADYQISDLREVLKEL